MHSFARKAGKIVLVTAAAVIPAMFAQAVLAGSLGLRVDQPKSPSAEKTLSVSFVISDTDSSGRQITASCWKKGPSDGDFVKFGSDMAITPGGNTGSCEVLENIMDTDGTYAFRVTAATGEESVSETVSVEHDTAGPGDVRDYRKEKTNACEYTVHFKTADDGGVTARVEVYRSAHTSFYADHNSRIESVSVGSNEEKNVTNTIPECDKTYYYAVRAFDSAGNGSALVGDRETVTVLPTGTTGASGAILGALPVSGEGSILGLRTATGSAAEESTGSGEVKGESDITAAADTDGALRSGFNGRNLTIGGSLILLGLVIFFIRKKNTL